jgi:hypothetical protein
MLIETNEKAGTEYPPIFQDLMTISLLGAIYRAREDADIVGAAVEATMADPTKYRMYRALAQGIGGDAEYACENVGRHLDQHPDDDAAKVTLGIALMLAGRSDWRQPIDQVLATSSDQEIRQAANRLLHYLANRAATQ